jgi:hypothetical protein
MAVNCWSADIHPDMVLVNGNKKLFFAGQGVVQGQSFHFDGMKISVCKITIYWFKSNIKE